MAGTGLSDDQKAVILGRSKEAQNFIGSPLYNFLKEWITQEKERIMTDLAFDTRGAGEDKLSREQFVERRCAYWLMLETPIAVIAKWAADEKQLTAITEQLKKNEPD